MKLGVALGWHSYPFEALLDLARHAEALGYAVVFVDGDASMLPSLGDADVLDGLTVTTELLARTPRIEVTSIRLVHYWNAARLAQTLATLARIHPARVRLFVSVGGAPDDRRFGLPTLAAGERIRWLDETLDAVKALWRGDAVSRSGSFVQLDRARIRPVPPTPVPIHVAGAGPRLVRVVARHADAWDVNLPPVRARVARAVRWLERACLREGRDPARILRSMWLFTRPDRHPHDPGLRQEFLRLNPWFRDLEEAELKEAILSGPAGECRERIAAIARDLGLDLPVVDLSGLDPDAARHALEGLAPTENAR